LERCRISIASKPILANVSTQAIVDPGHIRQELYDQIFQVVNWRHAMEKAVQNSSSEIFIEIGPKKVLTRMLQDVSGSAPTSNVEDMNSLESTVSRLSALHS
jgi:malonyl CoA-acyl carrier protein transacylase